MRSIFSQDVYKRQDIDGDGRVEIGVCVYKTAKFHPVPAKRPFFYALQDGRLQPVWLGSRLARPFADYRLFDLDGDGVDEIVSIESVQSGNQLLALYDWKGFGFEVQAISDEYQGEIVFLTHTNTRQDAILVNICLLYTSVDGEHAQLPVNM